MNTTTTPSITPGPSGPPTLRPGDWVDLRCMVVEEPSVARGTVVVELFSKTDQYHAEVLLSRTDPAPHPDDIPNCSHVLLRLDGLLAPCTRHDRHSGPHRWESMEWASEDSYGYIEVGS